MTIPADLTTPAEREEWLSARLAERGLEPMRIADGLRRSRQMVYSRRSDFIHRDIAHGWWETVLSVCEPGSTPTPADWKRVSKVHAARCGHTGGRPRKVQP